MKISSDTLNILKNFSEINTGIHFKKGDSLSIWHPGKYVLAEATIKEKLTKNFTVFDLNRFLSISSLFDSPEFDFESDRIVISSNNRSVNFFYAEPSLVLDPEDRATKYREQSIKGSIAKASINHEDLKSLKQAASILNLPDISVVGKNNKIVFTAQDTENSASDSFKVEVQAELQQDFQSVIKTPHFKILDGDYEFISHPKLAYFKNQTTPVEYWIAYQSDES